MSSTLKPITVFGGVGGPNPWKVIMVLNELNIPYTHSMVKHEDLHTPVFEKYNPNGRVPAILDPNNDDFVLWESGAIIEYIVERYDTKGKLSFPGPGEEKNKYLAKQWLHFQMSGQGPYYGQAVWFAVYHAEKVPSAVERYKNEIKRVVAVRDNFLRLNKAKYLVGGRLSYADISFVMWDAIISFVFTEGEVDWEKTYPDWFAWHQRLVAVPGVKKALDDRTAAKAAADAAAAASKE